MFSMPGECDLVQSFVFGQGRIQISSLACLFDFVIWNEWFTEVSYYDLLTSKIYQVEGTILVSFRIFVNKIYTYRLKRW